MLRPTLCLRALFLGSGLTLGLSAFAACSSDSGSGFTDAGGSGGADAGASGDAGSGGTTSGGTGGSSSGGTTGKTGGGAPSSGGSAGSPAAGRGGEPSGGSSSGGKASSGGTSSGGTSSGGKASGGSPSGGESGAPGKEACQLPPDTGPCDGAFSRFYFDPASGLCEPFSYGGCEGNENNFESMDDCYAACGGEGDDDLTACEMSAECTLVDRSCCAACEPVSLDDLVAINSSQINAYVSRRPCTDVICQECPMPELGDQRPWFGATCREGHCVPFDARETDLTECVSSDDCSLRMGFGCCEGCSGATGVVAINDDADLETWLCGGLVACPACEPIFPESLEAVCEDDRCQVVDQSQ